MFESSRYGIERLEICESKDDKNPKIITLENCVKITQEPSTNLISIVKKTATLTLNAINEDNLKEWVNALQNVAFRNKNELNQNLSAIEEDNDLYCSSYGDGLFIVSLVPSEASIRCNIDPKCYLLQLTATELQLKTTCGSKNVISYWPYRFIRKYGYRDGKFTFEAGRKCSTGEGVFILDHTNPQDVFRCMSSKMKCMKKLIAGDVVNIDSCENQLTAAASMEAGSRSPLPPSFSSQHSTDGEISSNQIMKVFSLNDSNCSPVTSAQKIVPNKPPRRTLSSSDKALAIDSQCSADHYINGENTKQYKHFEPVTITTTIDPNKAVGSTVILKPSSPNSNRLYNVPNETSSCMNLFNDITERDYESIENITDAWKTLGVNEVKHIENIRLSDNDFHWSHDKISSPREKMKEPLQLGPASKIIDIDIGESSKGVSNILPKDFTYDRLEFLSANNKTSSGYKTIVSVPSLTNAALAIKPPQNEYELINVPDTDSYRKADDSHLGYGMLRKSKNSEFSTINVRCSSNESDKDGNKLNRQNNNELNYTQVRKPKRV